MAAPGFRNRVQFVFALGRHLFDCLRWPPPMRFATSSRLFVDRAISIGRRSSFKVQVIEIFPQFRPSPSFWWVSFLWRSLLKVSLSTEARFLIAHGVRPIFSAISLSGLQAMISGASAASKAVSSTSSHTFAFNRSRPSGATARRGPFEALRCGAGHHGPNVCLGGRPGAARFGTTDSETSAVHSLLSAGVR
jgi:hypothetical protein